MPLGELFGVVMAGDAAAGVEPSALAWICGVPTPHFAVQAALHAGCRGVAVFLHEPQPSVVQHFARTFPGQEITLIAAGDSPGIDALARLIARLSGTFLILRGDMPLLRGHHLKAILEAGEMLADPTALVTALGLGSAGEDDIDVCAGDTSVLRDALASLTPRVIRLADIVSFARGANVPTPSVALSPDASARIADCDDLAEVEATVYQQIARRLRLQGAVIRKGALIDAQVVVEPGATIGAGVVLRGRTRVARGATVDVGSVLTNVDVGEEAVVRPYCVVTDSRVGARAHVGPFAHVRPDSDLGEGSHVGNFVETKKTRLGPGAMAHHLAYLGDSVIGARANVGAGTIFCNSDGYQKFTTTIGEGAFIGSDSQIIAPVTIGANAYVATGTTVTRDVPEDALAIGRARQENKDGYAKRLRARFIAGRDAKRG